ncbi:MAG: hypothetical protein PHC62_00710 [Candidatus Izemoplasmatales bacterium]|nr:hypothetical protein [Candidatus Izemoplasmatales bacterium]
MAKYEPTGVRSGVFKNQNINDATDFGPVLQSNKIYDRNTIKLFSKYNRFGVLDPYNGVTTTREYLFFTKPDLHICTPGTGDLNPQISNYPFFRDLHDRYPHVIGQLQSSRYSPKTTDSNVFMTLLSNSVKNTLDLPPITANSIDTAVNIFGSTIQYRGDGYTDDENVTFTLEFEDTKYLELYQMLKAYEEYERLKLHGIISPPNTNKAKENGNGFAYTRYHENKELHDHFSIYKFIVGEDYETILYWACIYGCTFKSVPRDAFSDTKVDSGLRYSVEFGGWLVDDMNPSILVNFNRLIQDNMKVADTVLPIYNTSLQMVDGRWATVPMISMRRKADVDPNVWNKPSSMEYDYVLRWRE